METLRGNDAPWTAHSGTVEQQAQQVWFSSENTQSESNFGFLQKNVVATGHSTENDLKHLSQTQSTPSLQPTAFGSSVPNFDHEPPLLEELGVNPRHIYLKTITVINPLKEVDPSLMKDADLSGPLIFVGVLGTFLLLRGKLQYGHLFGLLIFGSFGLNLLLNLMSQVNQIDYIRTLSIVGYSMIPMVGLAGISVAANLRGWFGVFCGISAIAWCTQTSTRFFMASLGMIESKWLISYLVCMYYCIFVLVTVF